jgi:hypothetical protein
MSKFVTWTFGFVLGGLFGWAFSRMGMYASFMAGLVGTGLGIYLGRKLARHYGV